MVCKCFVCFRSSYYCLLSLSSSMTSVPFSRLLQPLPMNLSSPETLTFISIILQTLSRLSFCLYFLLSILVNTFTSLRTTKITFLIFRHVTCSGCLLLSCTHWSPSDHFPVFTRLSINPAPLPPPTLHSFRQLHSIDVGFFLTELESSQLISDPPKSL